MNQELNKNVETLRPFTCFLMTIGELPTSYLMSMTYYEQIIWFTKYLQDKVIPAINNNAEAVKEIQDFLNTLDLQDEVDNKLDEMVEDGTLQEIIADYLNSKAIFGFDTVDDLKSATNLIDGSYAETLGYYSINDGGGALYQIVEDTPVSGYYETLNNGLYAILILKNNTLNIRQLGAKGDGVNNDTTIFQYAFNNFNNIYIPNGNYIVNGGLTFNSETQVKGESMSETIITSSYLSYLFNYETEVKTGKWNIKSNIKFENFKVVCKYFMKINDDTLADASWVNQATILGITLKNIYAYGIYDTLTDTNRETNVVPTLSELKEFGLGINFSSVFDGRIENCRIENFGLGIYLKGCDINVITNNRLNKNGIQIWLDRISSFGSQNTISNNDIIVNKRYGAIRVNGTRQDAILNNYFEEYSNSACFIYADNEISLLIDGNRIDNPQVDGIDVFRVAPINGDIITNNRTGPNQSYKTYINVLSTNYKGTSNNEKHLAIIRNNVDSLYIKNYELCLTDLYNPLVLSPYSLHQEVNFPDGQYWSSPWIVSDSTAGMYAFNNTETGVVRYNFKHLKALYRKSVKIRITYRSTERETLYSVLRCDGTDKRSTTDNIINDGAVHSYEIDLSGTDTNIYDHVRLTINSYPTVWIYSVEMI